jgi:hypothetical protein
VLRGGFKKKTTRVTAATDMEANAGRGKCVSRLGRCEKVTATLAAVREALASVGGHMAAFERIL